MKKILTKENAHQYDWIDLTNPSKEELMEAAKTYELHEASVQDSLEPDHLPKFEHLQGHTFAIMRIYSGDDTPEGDSVKELTDKLEIFVSERAIITIHSKPWKPLEKINAEFVQKGACDTPEHVFREIVKQALLTFDAPASQLTDQLEHYENEVFLKSRQVKIVKGMYFLKRKADVIERMLNLSYDVIDNIDPAEASNAYTRDIRDLYVKQKARFDSIAANANHLLTTYFNISSQKTNETIRVLTVFSVFFMPLTFIVGVYGMNFKYMPELAWRHGYAAVWVLMGFVVLSILFWFRKKHWL